MAQRASARGGNATLTRRRWLALSGASVLTAALPRRAAAAAAASQPSMGALANAAGLRFGAFPGPKLAQAPPAYRDLFIAQCRLLAPDLGWSRVSPTPSQHNYEVDPNAAFATAHAMPITGAHLLWHHSMPNWFAALDRRAAEKAIVDHITAIVSHYGKRVYSWNVVNEGIEPHDGRPDGLRNTVLLQKLGPDYLPLAFHAARAADPQVLLVYNDFSLELADDGTEARRRALFAILDRLARAGAPIDAVGLQSHLALGSFGASFHEIVFRQFLQELAARKLKLMISELDVLDIAAPADVAERDRMVADAYAQFLGAALDEPAVVELVTSGLCDQYTWLNAKFGFNRPDHLPTRPLPFDTSLRPKPAFVAIVDALRQAPHRQA